MSAERRHTVQLIDYWKDLKFESDLPIVESFNISFISNSWLNSMIIFSNLTNNNFHAEFVGKNIEYLFKSNLINNIQFASPISKVTNKFKYINEKASIVIDQGNFVDIHNNEHKYRSCLLPFGTSKNNITHWIMYLSYQNIN